MNEDNIEKEVTPINEVKIEEDNSVSNQLSNDKTSKNSKFSTVMLILFFIVMFVYIMGMPYINEFINNLMKDDGLSQIELDAIEEEKRQEQENKKPVTPEVVEKKELICTLNNTLNPNYTLVEVQKLYYNNNKQILNSSYSYQYTFVSIDEDYNSLKTKCDEDSLKYVTHEGYTMSCSYDDVNIEISHEFDLETFEPIVDGENNIEANVSYKDNIETVKNTLVSQGYTCQ